MLSPKLRKIARLLLRVLLVFLVLDLLLLGGWLWKGPDLLSPLIPRVLAFYLPSIHQVLRFDSASLDHYGVLTFQGVTMQVPGPQPLQIEVRRLKASLSFASISHLEPIFSRVRGDSVRIKFLGDSLPYDVWTWADTALQSLHDLPDMRVFQNARVSLRQGLCERDTDTLLRWERMDMVMRRNAQESRWKLLVSGQAQYQGDLAKFDSLGLELRKPMRRPFQVDTVWGKSVKLTIGALRTQFSDRNEALRFLREERDYRWLRHSQPTKAYFQNVNITQNDRMDFSLRGLHVGGDSIWQTQFSMQGWMRTETVRMDSVQLAFRLPMTTGRLRIDSLNIDSLAVRNRAKPGLFANRSEASEMLYYLNALPTIQFAHGSRVRLRALHFQMENESYVKAQDILWRQDTVDYRLSTGRLSVRLLGDGLETNSLRVRLSCGADSAGCRVRTLESDSLGIVLPTHRMQNGPSDMLRELAALSRDKIWRMLGVNSVKVPVYRVSAGSGFRWRFTGSKLAVDTTATGPRIRFSYGQWNAQDALWANGWLVQRAQKLSKGTFTPKNLGQILDTLEFGSGLYAMQYVNHGYHMDWELGRNKQTLGEGRILATVDTTQKSLSGNVAWRNVSVTQLFPQLFATAFAQGARVSGNVSGKFNYKMPLTELDALRGFKATGDITVQNSNFAGLNLQKQSLVQGKAPLYAGPVPFTEIRLESVTLDPQGLQCAHIVGKGSLISFSGWFNARYDASFYLNSQAVIPPTAAQRLPTLTRNGLEPTSDGGRKTPLVIYGTPSRQELSNQEKLIGRAVLNNLRKGFGLFGD